MKARASSLHAGAARLARDDLAGTRGPAADSGARPLRPRTFARLALVNGPPRKPVATVHLCIPDDQLAHLPEGLPIPAWPAEFPTPRVGEVVYLTSTSAWLVRTVIHELLHGDLRTEVWIERFAAARAYRDPVLCRFNH